MPAAYDAAAALERIEHELIDSMMRNLRRHLDEETDMGFDWEQWQVLQLKHLETYRKRNLKKYGPQFRQINLRIKHAIQHARVNGQKEEEKEILKTLAEHPELNDVIRPTGNLDIQGGSFFKINEQKLDALVKATENDLTKAEHAVLRRCNDQYRKIIFDAQMYANTGAGTVEKAIDMATHDFIARGIDSIVYKNGSRHTISDYADMAIRTANRRATLMGAGEMRKKYGRTLVIVNRRGTMTGGNFGHACPQCIPWLGQILIDDVYSGGKPDGKHQLVSTAMQQGFLHPRCKDSFHTYYPGITSVPDPVTKKELKAGAAADKRVADQQKAERQVETHERLAKTRLDPENRQLEEAKAEKWDTRLEYMSHSFRPNYDKNEQGYDLQAKNGKILRIRVKRVINSAFDLYAGLSEGRRSRSVRLVEALLSEVVGILPEGFELPPVAVLDFLTNNLNPNAIGGFDSVTGVLFINSKYSSREKIISFVSRELGYFSNNTEFAPILHELGHKYYYDVIRELAQVQNIQYNEAKRVIDRRLMEYIDADPELFRSISIHCSANISRGNYSEVIAECFGADNDNAKFLLEVLKEGLK